MADTTKADGDLGDPPAPATNVAAVSDSKGAKVLATPSLVDEFRVPQAGGQDDIVITPAGTKVPASKVAEVRQAAFNSRIQLFEVTE